MFKEIELKISPIAFRDVVVAQLANAGFDSFWETETGLKAYISEENYTETMLTECQNQLSHFCEIQELTNEQLPDINWNEEWETKFEPIFIEDKALICAPFHQIEAARIPELVITIQPKMSFGTGHHATTYMMVQQLFNIDLKQKTVLDYGSGTAVLAIAAEKMGAKSVLAIDNDEWAYTNSIENLEVNNCTKITSIQGEKAQFIGQKFDLILANINRNVILDSLQDLQNAMNEGGDLLTSGILEEDAEMIIKAAQNANFKLFKKNQREKWMCIHFKAEKR